MTILYNQHHFCMLHMIFENLEYYLEKSYCFATRMRHHYFVCSVKTALDYFDKKRCLQDLLETSYCFSAIMIVLLHNRGVWALGIWRSCSATQSEKMIDTIYVMYTIYTIHTIYNIYSIYMHSDTLFLNVLPPLTSKLQINIHNSECSAGC